VQEIIKAFNDKCILIIGDVMVDAYIWGSHTRMSPEAPVPVVDVIARDARLGGAANVALNIQGAGAEPIILSVVGQQGRAAEFSALMNAAEMSDIGIVWNAARKCTVKTRVISNEKHMMRVDEEQTDDISLEEENELLERLKMIAENKKVDAVILQDYNKGVLTERLIQEVLAFCQGKNILVTVDPKKKNFKAYTGCVLFKPNLKELKEGLGLEKIDSKKAALDAAVTALKKDMPHRMSMITLSERGIYFRDGDESDIWPVHPRKIIDVSGAGDTVIAIATLALSAGAALSEAAWLANLAGGMVCEKVGVQPISQEALLEETLSKRP